MNRRGAPKTTGKKRKKAAAIASASNIIEHVIDLDSEDESVEQRPKKKKVPDSVVLSPPTAKQLQPKGAGRKRQSLWDYSKTY